MTVVNTSGFTQGAELGLVDEATILTVVKAVLESTGKYATWWTRVFGQGVKILYRSGKENVYADALSQSLQDVTPQLNIGGEAIVAAVDVNTSIASLLQLGASSNTCPESFELEQQKDSWVHSMTQHLQSGELPNDQQDARKLVAMSSQFAVIDGILYHIDPKLQNRRCVWLWTMATSTPLYSR